MRVTYCDECGKEIPGGVYKTHGTTDDFCSSECVKKRKKKLELVNHS